jgi:hypothetical protein
MTPELLSLVEEAVDSLIKLEVALFFQGNPGATDTAEGVALRIYRKMEDVAPALSHLAHHEVLAETILGNGRYTVYSLTPDRKMRELLDELSRAYYYDVEDRVKISRLLVKRQQQRREGRETPGDGEARP